MRTRLQDALALRFSATLKLLFFSTPKPVSCSPVRVFAANGRWAIEFQLDDTYQIWYTDSEEQARQFVRNLETMGVENSECAG